MSLCQVNPLNNKKTVNRDAVLFFFCYWSLEIEGTLQDTYERLNPSQYSLAFIIAHVIETEIKLNKIEFIFSLFTTIVVGL